LDIYTKLLDIIEPLLEKMGVELVELQYNRSKRSSIRLFVWEESGISLDRCTEISRDVSELLDRKNIIDGRYVLEVSSPGIDRPLKTKRDFQRQIGRTVKVTLSQNDSTTTVQGSLISVSDRIVTLNEDKKQYNVELDKIVKAKVVVDFSDNS
jgi:ribosome maturation factor RimP